MGEKKMEKAKILIVDDERDIMESTRRFISKKIDCVIEEAADSATALEKINQNDFDLVLLDIKMPGLSGIDVLRKVVGLKPQTKFLVISGYDSDEIASQVLKFGAVDFLSKPQTRQAIELKVEEILISIGKYVPLQ